MKKGVMHCIMINVWDKNCVFLVLQQEQLGTSVIHVMTNQIDLFTYKCICMFHFAKNYQLDAKQNLENINLKPTNSEI